MYNSAGNPQIFAETCTGVCYDDYVIGPPSTYNNAYFEIKSIHAFHDPRYPLVSVNTTTNNATTVHVQDPGPTFLKGPLNGGVSDVIKLRGLGALLMVIMACIMVLLDSTF